MQRRLAPEWLDTLPPKHPEAIRSRRDLRRINWIMGNVWFVTQMLAGLLVCQPARLLVEFGTGDGWFLLRVLRRLPVALRPERVLLLDRRPVVDAATLTGLSRCGCVPEVIETDVFTWIRGERPAPGTIVLANLFLHHFEAAQLRELFTFIAGSSLRIVACDPRRSRFALAATYGLASLGCNRATRHDARISVWAGFRDRELSGLWPGNLQQGLSERAAGPFSHCFVAQAGVRPTGGVQTPSCN
jgi:hypothetical protein